LLLAFALVASARVMTVEKPVPEQYIIQLHPERNVSTVRDVVRSLGGDTKLRRVWSFSGFRGLSISTTSQAHLEKLSRHPDVDFIEQNGVVRHYQQCNIQRDATWGIDRVNHDKPDLDGEFIYQQEGAGVTVYVVDTGIRLDHIEFGGRAIWGTNTIDGVNNDGNGHGTHVAGTIGGRTYGVAKAVSLVAVKTLDARGSGTYESIIDGLEWVVGYNTGGNKKGIANLSLGGGKSVALNNACDEVTRAGVLMVVAAGNENSDACTRSPASANTVIAVGSTVLTPLDDPSQPGEDEGQEDSRSSFSNYGTCVKVFAPGTLITSAWHTTATAIHTISGTSMACPHVVGVGANLWSKDLSKTAAQLQTEMSNDAITGLVNLNCVNAACRSTTNKFIHLPMC